MERMQNGFILTYYPRYEFVLQTANIFGYVSSRYDVQKTFPRTGKITFFGNKTLRVHRVYTRNYNIPRCGAWTFTLFLHNCDRYKSASPLLARSLCFDLNPASVRDLIFLLSYAAYFVVTIKTLARDDNLISRNTNFAEKLYENTAKIRTHAGYGGEGA